MNEILASLAVMRQNAGGMMASGVKMSEELKKCIWWIVANSGKKWTEIKG